MRASHLSGDSFSICLVTFIHQTGMIKQSVIGSVSASPVFPSASNNQAFIDINTVKSVSSDMAIEAIGLTSSINVNGSNTIAVAMVVKPSLVLVFIIMLATTAERQNKPRPNKLLFIDSDRTEHTY